MRVHNAEEEARMGILILKILMMWSLVSVATGLGVGAVISRGERVRKEEFLSCAFASMERLQESRG
jgi:hypothetical protein